MARHWSCVSMAAAVTVLAGCPDATPGLGVGGGVDAGGDGGSDGGTLAPKWGCLGHVVEPAPDTSKRVEFTLSLIFADSKVPLLDATVDICDSLDYGCTNVSTNFPKGVKPGPDGKLDVSVVQGFDGFFRITGAVVADSRFYVGRPLVAPPAITKLELISKTYYANLASKAGLTIDTSRGTAVLYARDCQGKAASGVRFETTVADSKSTEFYVINGVPTKSTSAGFTDEDGYGGFFNLAPSFAVASSLRASDDVYVGESSFQVLANTISYVLVLPTPK